MNDNVLGAERIISHLTTLFAHVHWKYACVVCFANYKLVVNLAGQVAGGFRRTQEAICDDKACGGSIYGFLLTSTLGTRHVRSLISH